MATFQKTLLNHLKFINKWLATHGLEASLQLPDMGLRVASGGRQVTLQPRFLQAGRDRKAQVAPTLHQKSNGFAGWLASQGASWPETESKLAFKAYAAACGLRVPAHFQAAGDHGEVLIKCTRPAYVESMRGPFSDLQSRPELTELGADEYYEQFICGRSLRAWFWRGQPACAVLEVPAEVVGDGTTPIRRLLHADRRNVGHHLLVEDIVACMAARAGYALDDVLPANERLRVDFRYGSVLQAWENKDPDVLQSLDVTLLAQIRTAGAAILKAVPADVRMSTVFTLDAVVDAGGRAWWLDMDADPLLHPAVYPAMLGDLLGLRPAVVRHEDEVVAGDRGLVDLLFGLQAC